MTDKVTRQLKRWANQYETVKFIESDPIQIPHSYVDKRDIEITAFVTAWLAWGNRKSIIAAADYIDRVLFKDRPYAYIMDGEWMKLRGNFAYLYRTYTHADFAELCCVLRSIYIQYPDMEYWLYMNKLRSFDGALRAIRTVFQSVKGIPAPSSTSACKRLCMFLRWMVRKGPVDFDLWTCIPRQQLLIPLDTHVIASATHLGIGPTRGERKFRPTLTNARILTAEFQEVFPTDPARADFALFGAGIAGIAE